MAGAPLIITERNTDGSAHDGVFSDLTFFVTQRLPSRSHYVQQITDNGGKIVKIESTADYLICDHMRKDAPQAGVSYQWIDETLKHGQLLETSAYAVAKVPRSTANRTSTVPKGTRTPFTNEDDRVLLDWVEQAEAAGDAVRGNAIYETLAALNPRHTAQAWRSRYVKNLVNNHPRQSMTSSAPPRTLSYVTAKSSNSQPRLSGVGSALSSELSRSGSGFIEGSRTVGAALPFDQSDFDQLLGSVEVILDVDPSQIDKAWQQWAEAYGTHGAREWRDFFHRRVLPEYIKRNRKTEPVVANNDQPRQATEETSARKRRRSSSSPGHEPSRSRQRLDPATSDNPGVEDEGQAGQAHISTKQAALDIPSATSTIGIVTSTPSKVINDDAEAGKLITSDENRAANSQLMADLRPPGTSSGEVVRSGMDENGVATRENGTDSSLAARGLKNLGDALTEENLAVQQAHHQAQLRGIDIPEDDEAKDRSEFIDYLQGVTIQAKESAQGSSVDPEKLAPGKARHSAQHSAPSEGDSVNDREEDSALPQLPEVQNRPHQMKIIVSDTNEAASADNTNPTTNFNLLQPANGRDGMGVDLNLDLSIPEPASGFFLGSTPAQSSQLTSASEKLEPVETFFGAPGLDTQEIFGAAIQDVDMTIPDPVQSDPGQHDGHETPRASFTSSAQLNEPTNDSHEHSQPDETEVDMETWMERMAHEGYKQAAIIDALKCTSLRPDLAEYVLLEIKNGRALPRDVPGVWSESDDRILQGCDARRLRALEEKHGGWSALDQRREFLEGYS
jgi:hypothetical protein